MSPLCHNNSPLHVDLNFCYMHGYNLISGFPVKLFYNVVQFQIPSYNTFRVMNFFPLPVWFLVKSRRTDRRTDGQTDRRKVMHMSPPCKLHRWAQKWRYCEILVYFWQLIIFLCLIHCILKMVKCNSSFTNINNFSLSTPAKEVDSETMRQSRGRVDCKLPGHMAVKLIYPMHCVLIPQPVQPPWSMTCDTQRHTASLHLTECEVWSRGSILSILS